MTTVATRLAAICDMIEQHRVTGTAISARRAATISAMIDDVTATAAEGRPRACRRKRRMASASRYKQEGRRLVGGGGQGQGVIVRARHRATGQAVAVKSLHRRSGGSYVGDVLREACFTATGAGHPSLVAFRTVARRAGTADYSITQSRRGDVPFPVADVRRVMRQLLAGAEAMHQHGVVLVHRDIKPDNILVSAGTGGVKICNLGAAKSVSEKDPPSQFAGTTANADHGTPVDMWSLGCVMAELLTGQLLFAGAEYEAHQLFKIFDALGVPCKREWQALKPQVHDDKVEVWRARQVRQMRQRRRNRLRELVPPEILSAGGFQVLRGLLTCDPEKRVTAAAALQCPWFTSNDVGDAPTTLTRICVTDISALASKPWSLAMPFVARLLGFIRPKVPLH
ncbi:hypothetical protein BS78_02G052200 [Paspalum vaginatum]|nr:hypothetical protein BS78_02G052200 [Paspalum vaginatum]